MHIVSLVGAVLIHAALVTLFHFSGSTPLKIETPVVPQQSLEETFDQSFVANRKQDPPKAVSLEELGAMAQSALRDYRDKKPVHLPLSIGEFLIWSEVGARQDDSPLAIANYLDRYRSLKERFTKKPDGGDWRWILDLQHYLQSHYFRGSYAEELALIIDFYKYGLGNCDARTRIFSAAVWDTQLEIPAGYVYGIQSFTNHIQPVLYKDGEVISLISGKKEKGVRTPIYRPESILRGFLETQNLDPIVTEKDLLLVDADPGIMTTAFYDPISTNTNIAWPSGVTAFAPEEAALSDYLNDPAADAVSEEPPDPPAVAPKDATQEALKKLTGRTWPGERLDQPSSHLQRYLNDLYWVDANEVLGGIQFLTQEQALETINYFEQDTLTPEQKAARSPFLPRSGFVVVEDPNLYGTPKTDRILPEAIKVNASVYRVRAGLRVILKDEAQVRDYQSLTPKKQIERLTGLLETEFSKLVSSSDYATLIAFLDAPMATMGRSAEIPDVGQTTQDLFRLQSYWSLLQTLKAPRNQMNQATSQNLNPAFVRFAEAYWAYLKKIETKPLTLLRAIDKLEPERQVAFYSAQMKFNTVSAPALIWLALNDRVTYLSDYSASRQAWTNPLSPILPFLTNPDLIGVDEEVTKKEVILEVQLPVETSKRVSEEWKLNRDLLEKAASIRAKTYLSASTVLGGFLAQGVDETETPFLVSALAQRVSPLMLEIYRDRYLPAGFATNFLRVWSNYFHRKIAQQTEEIPFQVERVLSQRFPDEPLQSFDIQHDFELFSLDLYSLAEIGLPASFKEAIVASLEDLAHKNPLDDIDTTVTTIPFQPPQYRRVPPRVDSTGFEAEDKFQLYRSNLYSQEATIAPQQITRLTNRCTGDLWLYSTDPQDGTYWITEETTYPSEDCYLNQKDP